MKVHNSDIVTRLQPIVKWAKTDDRVEALILVGSYARGDFRPDSDIDIMIISGKKESLLNSEWVHIFGEPEKQIVEEYGKCTSLRVFYSDGTEIEYGIVDTSWLDMPLDNGTKRVLDDGHKVLYCTKEGRTKLDKAGIKSDVI